MSEPVRIAIIGAGISGIAQAIRLKQSLGKRAEVTIYEKESRAGGIWRDSTWPGAGVDVPINLYSLYSDLNPYWKSAFASQPEVLAYWEGLIDKHELRHSIKYDTEYIGSAWLEDEQAHAITLDDKSKFKTTESKFDILAEYLIAATGPLAKPVIPEFPGLSTFGGAFFHNLRWDNSVQLEGKRVAVIGNGSSGIQLVPGVAPIPGVHLTHFIRSGGYFLPKVNFDFTQFQQWAFAWLPGVQRLYRAKIFLTAWLVSRQRLQPLDKGRGRAKQEQRLLQYLKDTAPAEYIDALTPHYPMGCKRVAHDAGWLKTLHRENVELVASAVESVSEAGLLTVDGCFYPVDVIIFATGSNVARYGVGLSYGLKGQEGIDLGEFYDSLGGPEAYLGLAIPHFPNYFATIGPNSSAGSWGFTSGNQTAVIARIIKESVELGLSSMQPTTKAFEQHNAKLKRDFENTPLTSDACTNWYRVGEKVTVPNSASSVSLWWQTRRTRWGDWTGTKRHAKTHQLESVYPRRIVRH